MKIQKKMRSNSRGWLFAMIGMIATCLVMIVTLVWCNIDRTNTTYFINIEQNKLRELLAVKAKLEVERERLLSPYELRMQASKLGLVAPKPGQIRKLEKN